MCICVFLRRCVELFVCTKSVASAIQNLTLLTSTPTPSARLENFPNEMASQSAATLNFARTIFFPPPSFPEKRRLSRRYVWADGCNWVCKCSQDVQVAAESEQDHYHNHNGWIEDDGLWAKVWSEKETQTMMYSFHGSWRKKENCETLTSYSFRME